MQPGEGDRLAELVPRYTVALLRAEDRNLGPHAAPSAAAGSEASGCAATDGAVTGPAGRFGAGPGAAAGASGTTNSPLLGASNPGMPSAATPLTNGGHAGLGPSAGAGPAAAADPCGAGQHGVTNISPGGAAANGGSSLSIGPLACNGVRTPPGAACRTLCSAADSEPGAGAARAAAAQQAEQPEGGLGAGAGPAQAAELPAETAARGTGVACAAAPASSSEDYTAGQLGEAAKAARVFAAVEAAATGVPRFPGDDLPAASAVAGPTRGSSSCPP